MEIIIAYPYDRVDEEFNLQKEFFDEVKYELDSHHSGMSGQFENIEAILDTIK